MGVEGMFPISKDPDMLEVPERDFVAEEKERIAIIEKQIAKDKSLWRIITPGSEEF